MGNLKTLPQYAIDRELFTSIFSSIIPIMYDIFPDYEGHDFKAWRSYDDECYILHKPSGTLVNWYKHLGRTNTCNKNLSIDEYTQFVNMFIEEVKE